MENEHTFKFLGNTPSYDITMHSWSLTRTEQQENVDSSLFFKAHTFLQIYSEPLSDIQAWKAIEEDDLTPQETEDVREYYSGKENPTKPKTADEFIEDLDN